VQGILSVAQQHGALQTSFKNMPLAAGVLAQELGLKSETAAMGQSAFHAATAAHAVASHSMGLVPRGGGEGQQYAHLLQLSQHKQAFSAPMGGGRGGPGQLGNRQQMSHSQHALMGGGQAMQAHERGAPPHSQANSMQGMQHPMAMHAQVHAHAQQAHALSHAHAMQQQHAHPAQVRTKKSFYYCWCYSRSILESYSICYL